jgi:hypothetical protein
VVSEMPRKKSRGIEEFLPYRCPEVGLRHSGNVSRVLSPFPFLLFSLTHYESLIAI